MFCCRMKMNLNLSVKKTVPLCIEGQHLHVNQQNLTGHHADVVGSRGGYRKKSDRLTKRIEEGVQGAEPHIFKWKEI